MGTPTHTSFKLQAKFRYQKHTLAFLLSAMLRYHYPHFTKESEAQQGSTLV